MFLSAFIISSCILSVSGIKCRLCKNGNKLCDFDDTATKSCPNTDDTCYVKTTYIHSNKSVAIDNSVNSVSTQFLCLEKTKVGICEGERNVGKHCFANNPSYEILCFYCCRTDGCNNVMPTKTQPSDDDAGNAGVVTLANSCFIFLIVLFVLQVFI